MTILDIEAEAARVLEPFVTGRLRRADRATGIAMTLRHCGYLRGGEERSDIRERVTNNLHCGMDWSVAEQAAAALDEAGLLAGAVTR